MQCFKDWLEVIYYITFIVLTGLIVYYTSRTYALESRKNYELLCQLVINPNVALDYRFGYSLEVYNAGNIVAKKVAIQIDNKEITTLDFVKPGSSAYYPIGWMGAMEGGNTPIGNSVAIIEKDKPIKVTLSADGKTKVYDVSTDILFATRGNITGSMKGIEKKLDDIKKTMDTEYQRKRTGK